MIRTPHRRSRRRQLLTPRTVWGALGIIALALLVTVLVKIAGTRSDLTSAASSATVLREAIARGDQEAADAALTDLQDATASAHRRTSGPLWSVGTAVPWLGDNFAALRAVSRAGDTIAQRALPDIVSVSTGLDLDSFKPRDGKVDLERLTALAPSAEKATRAFDDAEDELADIDDDGLLSAVREPVSEVRGTIEQGARSLRAVQQLVTVMPMMLGPDRRYLILLQNNAEVRATGGIPGSVVLVRAGGGRIERIRTGAGADFGRFDPPLRISKEEDELFGKRLGIFFNDVTLTPDFARSARLARAMLEDRTGVTVDGVFSFDPVAASYILDGAGSLTLDDGTRLTSGTIVDSLLNEAYLRYPDPDDQDDFFDDAASRLFDAFLSGKGDARTTITGLTRAVSEGRLHAWSAHREEQDVIATTPVGGDIRSGSSPRLGIYLNDGTGAKMEYYLRRRSTVTPTSCTDDGVQKVSGLTSLASDAPVDAAGLPESVIGPGFGTKPGFMRFNVYLYLPRGAVATSVTAGGVTLPTTTQVHEGRPVLTVPIRLGPGDRTTLRYTFRTAKGQPGDLDVETTPGSRAGKRLTVNASRCD